MWGGGWRAAGAARKRAHELHPVASHLVLLGIVVQKVMHALVLSHVLRCFLQHLAASLNDVAPHSVVRLVP